MQVWEAPGKAAIDPGHIVKCSHMSIIEELLSLSKTDCV